MEQINKVATVIKQICKILIENEVTYSEYKMIQIRLDDEVDKNATKNYLVQQIGEIDRNGYLDGATRVRFYEQLQHYEKDLHGNSYIHDEIERLKKENKL